MIELKWGEGMWGNPNARWGSPASHLLQPGDPNYVFPEVPATSTPRPKRKTMRRADYIQKNQLAFGQQLLQFKTTIGGYATLFGLTSAQTTAQAHDCDYFNYTLTCQTLVQGSAQQWGDWRDLLRYGGTPPPNGIPVAPVFPTSVDAVAMGVETRFRALVQLIKAHSAYNTGIGEALGIEGAEITGPDLDTLQADIDAVLRGGEVRIIWTWQGYVDFLDMIEIQVDRGDGKGFGFLAMDTTPGYTDTAAFPTTPTKWTYRAIFRVGDKRVGVWSKPAVVTVG